ncbi:hypothetical protein RUM43_008117 [Polyplax serrata]|uniref:Uncharacterized protein n=1 Tax=Polyplax serrata TaxID=468196 RepID=A0AAN8S890_POLSC
MFFKLHSFLFSNGFSKFISHQRALEKSIRGETGAAVREVTIPGGLAPVEQNRRKAYNDSKRTSSCRKKKDGGPEENKETSPLAEAKLLSDEVQPSKTAKTPKVPFITWYRYPKQVINKSNTSDRCK